MDLPHAQPKFFDTEHARGRKLQTQKIAFEVRGHENTSISPVDVFLTPSKVALIVEDNVFQIVYCGYRNIIQVFSNVSLRRSDRFRLFTASECGRQAGNKVYSRLR